MKLSGLKDILAFAIKREEEAARLYGNLLAMAEDESSKKLLLELQEDEKNHKRILQGLTKAKVESAVSKEVKDLKISDYLIEEPLGPEMNFQDLLIFAAKKEKKAASLYRDLAEKAKTKDDRTLFEFLAKQEKSHKLRLELEYEKHVLWEN